MLYDVLIAYIIFFNLIDVYTTLWFINNDLAVEANPIMHEALENGQSFFIFIKLFLVIAGCYILGRNKDRKIARCSILLAFVVYLLLMLYFWLNLASMT